MNEDTFNARAARLLEPDLAQESVTILEAVLKGLEPEAALELVRPVLLHAIDSQRRTLVRKLEREAFRPPRPVEGVRASKIYQMAVERFLYAPISVPGPHGFPKTRWRDATQQQHRLRIEYLRHGQVRGLARTIDCHRVSLRILKERHAACLANVPMTILVQELAPRLRRAA